MTTIGLTMYIRDAKKASASRQTIMTRYSGAVNADINRGNLKVTSKLTPGWITLLMSIEAYQKGKEGGKIRTKRHGHWPKPN